MTSVVLPIILQTAIADAPIIFDLVKGVIDLFHHTKPVDPAKPGETIPLTPDQTAAIQQASFDTLKQALVVAAKAGKITAIPDDATIRALIPIVYNMPDNSPAVADMALVVTLLQTAAALIQKK